MWVELLCQYVMLMIIQEKRIDARSRVSVVKEQCILRSFNKLRELLIDLVDIHLPFSSTYDIKLIAKRFLSNR